MNGHSLHAPQRPLRFAVAVALLLAAPSLTQAQTQSPEQPTVPPKAEKTKPNILMIMADDIGWFNVSAYNHGVMGYRTPNIDRIAKEGAMFTDWYAEQSSARRVCHGTVTDPHRPNEGWSTGRRYRTACRGHERCKALKPLDATGQRPALSTTTCSPTTTCPPCRSRRQPRHC